MGLNPLTAMGNALSLKRSKSEQNYWRTKRSTPSATPDAKKTRGGKSKSMFELRREASRSAPSGADHSNATATPDGRPSENGVSPKPRSGSSVRRKPSNNSQGRRASLKGPSETSLPRSDSNVETGADLQTEESSTARQRQQSARKKGTFLTPAHKDLLKECWDTSKHTEFGTRIYTRYFQKRPDIRKIFDQIEASKPGYSWREESKDFNTFLHELVETMNDPDTMESMSRDWGARYVELRDYGFKPQFWVPFSEIMTTECLYLDGGVHPVADMIEAWAMFITIMLGHMRDGFYSKLRLQRKQSKRRQSTWTGLGLLPQDSSDRESSIGGDILPQSASIQSGLDMPQTMESGSIYLAARSYAESHLPVHATSDNSVPMIQPHFGQIIYSTDALPLPADSEFSNNNNNSDSSPTKKTVGFDLDIQSDGYSSPSTYHTPPPAIPGT